MTIEGLGQGGHYSLGIGLRFRVRVRVILGSE